MLTLILELIKMWLIELKWIIHHVLMDECPVCGMKNGSGEYEKNTF